MKYLIFYVLMTPGSDARYYGHDEYTTDTRIDSDKHLRAIEEYLEAEARKDAIASTIPGFKIVITSFNQISE